MVALCRVAGHRSSRPGQPWFGCPLWPSMDYKFFMWKEDVDVVFAKEGNWKVLELKNKALEMKIENLEVEKMILVEENKKLRMKIAMSNCAGMKVYGFSLVKWTVVEGEEDEFEIGEPGEGEGGGGGGDGGGEEEGEDGEEIKDWDEGDESVNACGEV
ncbi:hypothetical protein QVD17_27147 [Tagetes erecta]|uniref:Uncharacterized protein n=1 Tax=Tagetes erecta TaxID=13708 RepID=A0AAD8KAN9_TARER|nr:hypothetical protein QVD17_27147 [Tagetes erecta]